MSTFHIVEIVVIGIVIIDSIGFGAYYIYKNQKSFTTRLTVKLNLVLKIMSVAFVYVGSQRLELYWILWLTMPIIVYAIVKTRNLIIEQTNLK